MTHSLGALALEEVQQTCLPQAGRFVVPPRTDSKTLNYLICSIEVEWKLPLRFS